MRVCLENGHNMDNNELQITCKISILENRRKVHTKNFLFEKKEDGSVLKVLHPNVETVKRSSMVRGSFEWNNVDAEIVNNYRRPNSIYKSSKILNAQYIFG